MKHYAKILELKCFSPRELANALGMGSSSIHSLLQSYMKKGFLVQVHRNLYVAMSLESKSPVASPYQIASKLTPTSYVSYHSALAYHGYRNQVSHEIYVSSESKFSDFEFDGIDYCHLSSRGKNGIIFSNGVRITDIERTVVDCLDRFDRVGGFEELAKALEVIPYLSEESLLKYLEGYGKAFLYQKAGFVLEHYREELSISEAFLEECLHRRGNGVRYFSSAFVKEKTSYNAKWGLMVPIDLWQKFE